ncbi:Bax inhibitor-1/YccA family protein [Aquihabitans sp. G128]|uniref:Bax inhibitor-1/YccA family protein n=1 Tax=Aquihabitans sp. G128 TaxID=2849779 RepID=UPI001C228EF6|nr:Bax inhibitor-1/YccA family protein [Aquihabitans sp. G128]QXC61658.1 Bax inhibitor-1/YccA family protein [Aquihabitans sp. G128]
MPSSNPALNDAIFQREIKASRSGGFEPGYGSPADEVPPGLFGGQGASGSTLPPPPGALGQERPTWQQPPAAPPLDHSSGETMRMGGTMSAAAVLLAIFVTAGWFGWQSVTETTVNTPQGPITNTDMPGWIFALLFVGLGLAIVTIMKPKIARITAALYSVAQGIVVGAISHVYEAQYDGIVLQAVGLTVGVFTMMLVLYATGTIRVTDKLRKGIFAATGAVAIVYLATLVLRIFGADVPFIHDSGPVGILFSLVVVGIAASNLLLDFDFIERGVKAGAPRYMEWYGAFGLILTLVWLYLELLRLLSKLRSR